MTITNEQASTNILAAVEAGTLVQGQWHGRGNDGREIACLLGSIGPDVNKPSDCNGDLMPMWLAELTPVLFDGIANNETMPIARRYGSLVARWHVLSQTSWDVILRNFLIRVIDDAVDAARPMNEGKAYWKQVVDACEQSKIAIASGNKEEKKIAADAAAYAARAAFYAAADVAAYAADVAAYAADAAFYAARAAVDAAAAAAADADAYAADVAAYLKLFTFLLDQIEAQCEISVDDQ